jgi:hypothetical protein
MILKENSLQAFKVMMEMYYFEFYYFKFLPSQSIYQVRKLAEHKTFPL